MITVAGAGLGLGRDVPGEAVLVGREDLGRGADGLPGHQSDDDHPEEVEAQVQDGDGDAGADEHQDSRSEYAYPKRPQQAAHAGALAGAHQEGADYRREDADGGHQQGQGVEIVVKAVRGGPPDGSRAHGGQGQRRDDGADVGLKQVGAHAGHVAHVVAHVVGDGRRVARVVLRYALLDLAHQVGPHVGGLGVDAAAHPGEQGDGGGAEAEPGHDGGFLEYPVEDGHAYQADAHHGDAHHRAAVEGHPAAPGSGPPSP